MYFGYFNKYRLGVCFVTKCKYCINLFLLKGFHRGLGPSISKVRSISLDKWKEEWVENLIFIGNIRANQYFEKTLNIKEKPSSDSPSDKKRSFIENKYKCKNFIDSNDNNPFEEIRAARKSQTLEKISFTSFENIKKVLKMKRKEELVSEQKKEIGSEISELKIDGKRMKVNKIEYERKEYLDAKNHEINQHFSNLDNKKKTDNYTKNINNMERDLEQIQFQHLSKQMRDILLKGNPLEVLEKIEELGNIESLI